VLSDHDGIEERHFKDRVATMVERDERWGAESVCRAVGGEMTSTTPANERDEARTPPSLFKKLDDIYGFKVDVTTSPIYDPSGEITDTNSLCEKYVSRTLQNPRGFLNPDLHLKSMDTAFGNPPFSRGNKDPFIKKAFEESFNGATVVLLLPMDSSTRAFHEYCMQASEWILFYPRVIYLRPNGIPFPGSPDFGSFACVFRQEDFDGSPVVSSMRWKE
jgi:hypothetical protein